MSMLYKNSQSIQEEKIYILASYFYCVKQKMFDYIFHIWIYCAIS